VNQIASSTISIGLAHDAWADSLKPADDACRQLSEELRIHQAIFEAQPQAVQELLHAQAQSIAEALAQGCQQLCFALPDQVFILTSDGDRDGLNVVPADFRRQAIGGWLDRVTSRDLRALFRQRLAQLEQSHYQAVATSAKLVRYATVKYMVHDLLPAGEPVTYLTAEGDRVPCVPPVAPDPAAFLTHRYYLPQWVALDEGRLMVDSIEEAEARFADMRRYMTTLHLAISLAPYIFADEVYQSKRYGMLGQLVNQGRALAHYQTDFIIGKIKTLAQKGQLNLGLSLSLPYFDDQALDMKLYDFDVIPGRTLFVPAFVVLAARREQDKVRQDGRLSPSTRAQLVIQLRRLAQAFDTCSSAHHTRD
jgi:hypothetical protein